MYFQYLKSKELRNEILDRFFNFAFRYLPFITLFCYLSSIFEEIKDGHVIRIAVNTILATAVVFQLYVDYLYFDKRMAKKLIQEGMKPSDN